MRQALYIFSGLPGSGKSTLARALAAQLGAAYLRIDTIEQALRDLCASDVRGEGYRLAYRVAADNLHLGRSVVADSCNPIELTRREWETTATDAGVPYVNIEVVCSDERDHRIRVESRSSDMPGLTLPTWKQVRNREYHPWTERTARPNLRKSCGSARRTRSRRTCPRAGWRCTVLSWSSCGISRDTPLSPACSAQRSPLF